MLHSWHFSFTCKHAYVDVAHAVGTCFHVTFQSCHLRPTWSFCFSHFPGGPGRDGRVSS